MEFAATRLSRSSVEIAVGTSINIDMIKEHYNSHIVILSLLMKVNIRMTFPVLSDYIKMWNFLGRDSSVKYVV